MSVDRLRPQGPQIIMRPSEPRTRTTGTEFDRTTITEIARGGFVTASLRPLSVGQLTRGRASVFYTSGFNNNGTTDEHNAIKTNPSRSGHVALRPAPNSLFLPDSFGLNDSDATAHFAEQKAEFEKRYPGAELVLGSVADVLQLIQIHLRNGNGRRLLGERDANRYTRTSDHLGNAGVIVGRTNEVAGPDVDIHYPNDDLPNLGTIALLVPKASV